MNQVLNQELVYILSLNPHSKPSKVENGGTESYRYNVESGFIGVSA